MSEQSTHPAVGRRPDRVDRNKATFNHLHEAFDSGDPERIAATIDEVFDPDVRIGTPLPANATGAAALKQVWATLLRAYPDLHVQVEDVIAEGDRLAVRTTVTGTHLGEYFGRAATGRSVSYNEMFVLRFTGGRITETAGVVDLLAQLRQLGVVQLELPTQEGTR